MAPAVATYEPRDPSSTVLSKVIAEHFETFLVSLDDDPDAKGLPAYVQREFYDYLQCGILAHGFLRLGCDTCKKEVLLAFSCKRRWGRARLLKRVFDLDIATCPFCQRGALWIIAAITQEAVITRMLRHLKRAAVPPPIAPARA